MSSNNRRGGNTSQHFQFCKVGIILNQSYTKTIFFKSINQYLTQIYKQNFLPKILTNKIHQNIKRTLHCDQPAF